jgi:hypothetical protein
MVKRKDPDPVTVETLQGPLVADVQKSLGELFGKTIHALREDVVKQIETNRPDSKVNLAIKEFTDSMLVMIAERLQATIPNMGIPGTPQAEAPKKPHADKPRS